MKKTPLYEAHCRIGGKIVDFAGWALPVQYAGILEEHHQTRKAAGLFDVSHMGRVIVRGSDAEAYIQKLVTNDISAAGDYQAVYSPACYEDGGVVDDLLVYRFDREYYMLVINASNTDKDIQWFEANIEGDVKIENVSEKFAQLAIQGPNAEKILQKLTDYDLSKIRFFRFSDEVRTGNAEAVVSRTGYTGEDGFEIYIDSGCAEELWNKLMDAGKAEGLTAVGLGARDTLRFEAALPLYGHEIAKDISPLEAGLDRFVKLSKTGFIGKEALEAQKQQGVPRTLVGFEMLDRGIPRSGYEVLVNGLAAGRVTTGGFSPSLNKNIGLALVESKFLGNTPELEVVIRNKPLKATIVKIPFYKKKYKSA